MTFGQKPSSSRLWLPVSKDESFPVEQHSGFLNLSGRARVEENGSLARHLESDADSPRYGARSRRLLSHVLCLRPVSVSVKQGVKNMIDD